MLKRHVVSDNTALEDHIGTLEIVAGTGAVELQQKTNTQLRETSSTTT